MAAASNFRETAGASGKVSPIGVEWFAKGPFSWCLWCKSGRVRKHGVHYSFIVWPIWCHDSIRFSLRFKASQASRSRSTHERNVHQSAPLARKNVCEYVFSFHHQINKSLHSKAHFNRQQMVSQPSQWTLSGVAQAKNQWKLEQSVFWGGVL